MSTADFDYMRDVADKAIAAVRERGAKYLPAVMQFTLADAAWLFEQGRPELAGEVLAAWAAASMSDTSAEAAGVAS